MNSPQTNLGPQWNWINENKTNWSLTKNQGALTIITQKGDVKETSNNVENLLLQNANTDWTIESRLTFSARVSKADQQGGIIAMQDEDNYVKLVYDFGDAGFLTGNEEYIELLVEDHGFQYPACKDKGFRIFRERYYPGFKTREEGGYLHGFLCHSGK